MICKYARLSIHVAIHKANMSQKLSKVMYWATTYYNISNRKKPNRKIRKCGNQSVDFFFDIINLMMSHVYVIVLGICEVIIYI